MVTNPRSSTLELEEDGRDDNDDDDDGAIGETHRFSVVDSVAVGRELDDE